jgi:hypothetical protein
VSQLLDIARWYVANGLSVIPVKADGSKAPLLQGWRKYSAEVPDDATLTQWYGDPAKIVGIGVPCGPASGNLVVLDFECDKESAYTEWVKRLPDELRELASTIPTVTTPSGGKHLWVRLAEPQPGGKLARYAGGKTKIEVRGEGHHVLAPGCPLECHKSGKPYEWDRDPEFIELDGEMWAALCAVAAECNEYSAPEQQRDREPRGTPAGDGSPGNDFNARGAWADTGLFDAGWTWSHKTGDDRGFLTRPGKESGISASVGQVSSKDKGYPYLFVWSTNAADFASETPYSRFAVYAILKHGGDYSAAAKELARQGYGERREFEADKPTVIDLSNFTLASGFKPFANYVPPPVVAVDAAAGEPRVFKWMSELSAQAEDTKWLWQGYLARRAITLFSAHPKSGKTTVLKYLLKAFGGGVSTFFGQPVTPCRVLYVTEEDESLWAERRDDLGIGDHVGVISQPFRGRATMPEWKAFIAALVAAVYKHHFDLVVMDTLSKLWPVREENDAGQVDEALMPLWDVKNADAALLLVHHTRKSGGGEFTAARGSSGLTAFTDLLMELRRHSEERHDAKRVVKAIGRFRDIPDEVLVELRPDGYQCLGDPGDPAVRAEHKTFDWAADLMAILEAANGEWQDTKCVIERLTERRGEAPKTADLRSYLDKRFADGEIERSGEGRKGDPYLWRITQ